MNAVTLAPSDLWEQNREKRLVPPLPEIPRARYLDPDLYRAELKFVFRRSWLFVAHNSEFPEPGAYRLIDLDFAPVVVVRGKDQRLRAFLNSCSHRGATVLRDTFGCVRAMSCQYHGWTFDLEGRLMSVTDPETFPDLNKEGRGLVELRCETWGTLVFINFDQKAPPLLDWLTPSLVGRYRNLLEGPLRVVVRRSLELNCNWKLSIDAFRESYHFDTIHRQSAALMADYRKTEIELNRNGHATLSLPFYGAQDIQNTECLGAPHISGLPNLPGATGPEFLEFVRSPDLFPNLSMAFQAVGFPIVTTWPLAIDRCRVDVMWVGADWGEGPMPPAWDEVLAGHKIIIDEDLANLVSIQKSLEANPDRSIPLSTQEVAVYQFHAEIDRTIGKDNVPARLYVPDVLEACFV